MDDVENPYVSPGEDDLTPVVDDDVESIDPRNIGKAAYVPTVAILMIVHGVLMFVAASILVGMIFWFLPQMSREFERQQEVQRLRNPKAPQLSNQFMTTMLTTVYGGISAVLFTIGVVDIVAGIRNYGYHGRVFGVISLVLNMGSVVFFWCVPFSIGLIIFGLIIYLSPEAERAFTWRSSNPKSA